MDALEFIRELKRMCKFYYDEEKGYCPNKCPAHCLDCMSLDQPEEDIERTVRVVEAWSAEHPHKTRQSVFLRQYPDTELDRFGVIQLCPASIFATYRDSNGECKTVEIMCMDCRRGFWLKEVD